MPTIVCPGCRQPLHVEPEWAGKPCRCPHCRAVMPPSTPDEVRGTIGPTAPEPSGEELTLAPPAPPSEATGAADAALQHPDWVFNARFSPDGSQVLTACRDGMARLWDWRTRRLAVPALAHADEVFDIDFSRDGRWLLTAGREGAARVWQRSNGKPVTPPLWVFGPAHQALFTPDAHRAVVAGLSPYVYSYALTDLDEPPGKRLSEDDLRTLGELVSGQALHAEGGAVNLTSAEWLDRWRHFRAAHPDFHTLARKN